VSTNAIIYISLCAALLLVSFISNKQKTLMGLKRGWFMFRNILVPFLNILILVSVVLFLIPPSIISRYLGPDSGAFGLAIAAVVGSITLIPGFISYPIAAGLIRQGASYMVVATFMTTLMMVGVVTLPLEIKYFGKRVAITRNLLNFVAAIIIGLVVGVVL
jgi:uncharacterized membrane protein YraQ (UPF0718 family)